MQSLDPHDARLYRRRARLSLTLGIAAVPTATAALVSQESFREGGSAVAVVLNGPLDTMWLIGYLLGGAFAAAGVMWRPFPRPEFEALGCWLLIGAMIVNGLAILAVRGPVAGALTALGLFALADILFARVRDLGAARRQRHADAKAYSGPERRSRPRTR